MDINHHMKYKKKYLFFAANIKKTNRGGKMMHHRECMNNEYVQSNPFNVSQQELHHLQNTCNIKYCKLNI